MSIAYQCDYCEKLFIDRPDEHKQSVVIAGTFSYDTEINIIVSGYNNKDICQTCYAKILERHLKYWQNKITKEKE